VTDLARIEAVVHGRVQGVGFRYFVWRQAMDMGLDGWVANAADGSVECRAEGDRQTLEELLAVLREGPPGAVVERVDVTWGHALGGLRPFTVRSGAHRGD
jgi:acylphosphatase